MKDCIHQDFTFTSMDDMKCSACGAKVSACIPDDDDAEVYFKILNKEQDGTYTTFQRTYMDQMRLMLLGKDLH